MRTDVYDKITNQIVAELEKGVRPWHKPWNAEHAAGRITRPLRANGIRYQGISVLMLWSAAMEKGYAAPIWMTFKQALKACVRKGEHGSLVVYTDKIIRTETDTDTGEESEHAIPFMKGYTVFNVEQVDGLPEHFYSKPAPRSESAASRALEHEAVHSFGNLSEDDDAANGADRMQQRGEISIHLSDDALIVANDGRPVTRRGVLALCASDLTEKSERSEDLPDDIPGVSDEAFLEAIKNRVMETYKLDPNRAKRDTRHEAGSSADYGGRCIWELIQNADDAMAPDGVATTHLIGTKGLGFKSVLEISDEPEVFSQRFPSAFRAKPRKRCFPSKLQQSW